MHSQSREMSPPHRRPDPEASRKEGHYSHAGVEDMQVSKTSSSVAALRALSMEKSKLESATREAEAYYMFATREHEHLTSSLQEAANNKCSSILASIVRRVRAEEATRRRLRLETRAAATRGFACSRRHHKAALEAWNAQHGGKALTSRVAAYAVAAEKHGMDKDAAAIEAAVARLAVRLELHGRVFAAFAASSPTAPSYPSAGEGRDGDDRRVVADQIIGRALALQRRSGGGTNNI